MAKNGAKGGRRRGAIRGRTQFRLPSGHYAKRDTRTGEIISVKADLKPYKGIVREKHPPASLPEQPAALPHGARRVTLPPILAPPAWRPRNRSEPRPAGHQSSSTLGQ